MSGKKEGGAEEEDMYIFFGGFQLFRFCFFCFVVVLSFEGRIGRVKIVAW